MRDYLTEQGVLSASVTSRGFGKNQPVASNDTAAGRQRNRRVELVVSGEIIGEQIGQPVGGPMIPAISAKAPLLVGLLLTPIAATAGALAAWRFGVEAGWTNTFFIASGFLSHWQVWCAVLSDRFQICACSLEGPRVRATT